MISLLIFILASICSASMDKCQFHYEKSVFTVFENPSYWNSDVSWENKYIDRDFKKGMRKCLWGLFDYPVLLTDFWHLMKSSMIALMVLSIVFYEPTLSYFNFGLCQPILWIFDFILFGIAWNLVFNLFFNRILAKR